MKKLLLLLLCLPFIGFTQNNNDFLTNLFLDSTQIKNQDFKLKLVGFVNPRAQEVKKYDDYIDRNLTDFYFSEILFLSDVKTSIQRRSSRYLGDYDEYNPNIFLDKCSFNLSGSNKNHIMVSPESLDYFPVLSFIKGKLLTITDKDSLALDIRLKANDYLFSLSKSSEYDNYGHKSMHFNLTDENENAYIINTTIINDESYLMMSSNEMYRLGFLTKFTNESKFKIMCDRNNTGEWIDRTRYIREKGYRTNYWSHCVCECDSNYISVYKTKTQFMENHYNLDEGKLIYLFKIIEQ
tara:strand:- start:619 stop:1503 length:885 start_codon:yes stop_codon:yes gene_type:complete